MRRHRISDGDAAALMRGEASAAHPELAPLAESIAEFRAVAYASSPRPSAELMSRFELAGASEISSTTAPTRHAAAISSRAATTSRPGSLRGVRRTLGWFAGLGVVAQVMLGVSVAAAAGATGVGAVVGISKLIEVVTPHPADDLEPGEQQEVPGSGSEETPATPVDEVPVQESPVEEVTGTTEQPVDDAEVADDAGGTPGNGNGNPGNGNGNGNPGNGNGNQGNGNGNQGNGNPGNGNGNENPGNGNGNGKDKG